MRFSQVAQEITGTPNALYELRDQLVADGVCVTDLVKGNVTEHLCTFPAELLQGILTDAAKSAAIYRPDPLGQSIARRAIASYYRSEQITAEHIVLTPGTSVSFWYCFKLVADAGDEVLAPTPSYPLFDTIAKLCGVTMTPYRLDESRGWSIDFDDLESKITKRTRAIVLISPHNPTGMVAGEEEILRLAEIATKHQLPIIADEVFCEFLFDVPKFARVADTNAPLVFTLNGFSKMFALPGIKLGWLAVSGEASKVRNAVEALEMISDTFLPVNEIVQFAAAEIFKQGQSFLKEYVSKVAECRTIAVDALAGTRLIPPRGGFYLTVPIDSDEDETALRLLEQERILVHPGYFYDIQGQHLVMTFINESSRVSECFQKLRTTVAGSKNRY